MMATRLDHFIFYNLNLGLGGTEQRQRILSYRVIRLHLIVEVFVGFRKYQQVYTRQWIGLNLFLVSELVNEACDVMQRRRRE
jgi:hypothetical protein